MNREQIQETVEAFAQGARRAREAGLDGVELHSSNGYLFTQFLSSAINDRDDEYGGSLENRARFLLDVIRAIRREVGADFHLQFKISAVEHGNALQFWEPAGNTLAESVQVCRWAEEAGADAVHVSSGSFFPHPRNPAGDFPIEVAIETYDSMISSGTQTFRNYTAFRSGLLGQLFRAQWNHAHGDHVEGLLLSDAKAIKDAVRIPVLCTGGFQTASVIRDAIDSGQCDAVTIARSLIANNHLPRLFAAGQDRPEKPCTYCNKCLVNALENPLGCYEESRFASREEMLGEIMSVFDPPPFAASAQE
jgi:2,4-dienoyl-CoA reductase (NADPH2)